MFNVSKIAVILQTSFTEQYSTNTSYQTFLISQFRALVRTFPTFHETQISKTMLQNSCPQATIIQSNTTQLSFNSTGYHYMHATCFVLHSAHPRACQHKLHTEEDARIWKREFVKYTYISYSYIIFLCTVSLLTCPRVVWVQAETFSLHVSVTSWIKIKCCFVLLNKCSLFL
jgi:hypothetical protein